MRRPGSPGDGSLGPRSSHLFSILVSPASADECLGTPDDPSSNSLSCPLGSPESGGSEMPPTAEDVAVAGERRCLRVLSSPSWKGTPAVPRMETLSMVPMVEFRKLRHGKAKFLAEPLCSTTVPLSSLLTGVTVCPSGEIITGLWAAEGRAELSGCQAHVALVAVEVGVGLGWKWGPGGTHTSC